ncbi:MAG: hypothetical protein OEY48_00185 [Gammaproteobacteria bacterium]|nr:hypothetical protein [Gammaproteobacteria bacterium]MDH5591246.1 hypothetical protein [Gammaproteobacteria bacterium]
MNKIILFIAAFLLCSTAFAEWRVETFSHEATNSKSQSAMVRNEDGFELAVFKTAEGFIWMDFSLSDNSFDELSQNQLPRFQIDDQKPVQMLRGFTATIVPAEEGIEAIIVTDDENISTDRNFSINHIIAERLPERVICPIWQGESRPHLGTIDALANGQEIRFDYVLSDGSKAHTTFTLKGAKQAIQTATNR